MFTTLCDSPAFHTGLCRFNPFRIGDVFLPIGRTYGTRIILVDPFFTHRAYLWHADYSRLTFFYPQGVPTARGLFSFYILLPTGRTYGTRIVFVEHSSTYGAYLRHAYLSMATFSAWLDFPYMVFYVHRIGRAHLREIRRYEICPVRDNAWVKWLSLFSLRISKDPGGV
ncbi:hypothetical protein [Membranihabitans maritimus]|uniref:hypothetical protein n=1 Tax=Membranihabitans maritimus TaxID=2904244 RepID=UPI001F3BA488|nr:hypothetical protein [Membranihabitans maritimus]